MSITRLSDRRTQIAAAKERHPAGKARDPIATAQEFDAVRRPGVGAACKVAALVALLVITCAGLTWLVVDAIEIARPLVVAPVTR